MSTANWIGAFSGDKVTFYLQISPKKKKKKKKEQPICSLQCEALINIDNVQMHKEIDITVEIKHMAG